MTSRSARAALLAVLILCLLPVATACSEEFMADPNYEGLARDLADLPGVADAKADVQDEDLGYWRSTILVELTSAVTTEELTDAIEAFEEEAADAPDNHKLRAEFIADSESPGDGQAPPSHVYTDGWSTTTPLERATLFIEGRAALPDASVSVDGDTLKVYVEGTSAAPVTDAARVLADDQILREAAYVSIENWDHDREAAEFQLKSTAPLKPALINDWVSVTDTMAGLPSVFEVDAVLLRQGHDPESQGSDDRRLLRTSFRLPSLRHGVPPVAKHRSTLEPVIADLLDRAFIKDQRGELAMEAYDSNGGNFFVELTTDGSDPTWSAESEKWNDIARKHLD